MLKLAQQQYQQPGQQPKVCHKSSKPRKLKQGISNRIQRVAALETRYGLC